MGTRIDNIHPAYCLATCFKLFQTYVCSTVFITAGVLPVCETNTVELISLPRGARFKKRSSPLFSQSLRGKVGHHGTHTSLTLEMVLYIIDIQCVHFPMKDLGGCRVFVLLN